MSLDLINPVIEGSSNLWKFFVVYHHLPKFGGRRYCSGGDMIFVVVEGQDSTFPHSDPSFLFISKAHDVILTHTKF